MRIHKIIVSFLIAVSMLHYGCKIRDESLSATKDNSSLVVTETGPSGNGLALDGNGKQQNYAKITVSDSGLMTLNFSFSTQKNGGFTKPVKVAIYDQLNQATPIATGDLIPSNPTWSGWISGSATIAVKQGSDIYVLVNHQSQLDDASAQGSISTQVLNMSSSSVSKIINFPASLDISEPIVGNSIDLQLVAPKALVQVSTSITIYAVSDKVVGQNSSNIPPCPNCKATMVLTDGGKDFAVPLNWQNIYISGEGLYQLDTGTYDLKFNFEGLLPGSMAKISVNAFPYSNNSGQPFTTGTPMGMLNLTFDQNNSKKAVFGGKNFGYYITSDRVTEAKLDVSLTAVRIINQATTKQPFPKKITGNLAGPGNSYKNNVASVDMNDPNFNGNFNGSLVTDLGKGKYRFLISSAGLDRSDILDMRGSVEVSNLSIADGGPDPSTFQDIGAVTTTPPNKYLVDLKVASQPHTPAVTPLDLASKSVLEGMEKIRQEMHVRIPKGMKRGPNNFVDRGTIEACLSNVAEHWSDIMLHYYCQYGEARSCYTNTIRAKAQGIGGDTTLDTPAKIQKLQTIRTETWTECSGTTASDPNWQWLVTNQADVFQYIMNSQTFAFNDEQQQAVLNKFYRVNDPTNVTECSEKRPRRAIDPADGSHCQSKKQYVPAMTSVGR